MKKSKPQTKGRIEQKAGSAAARFVLLKAVRQNCIGFLVALTILLSNCGYGPAVRTTLEPRFTNDCFALDSILTAGGWGIPIVMSGKITIDVKQYRVRGRFEMNTDARGNLIFEFTSNAALAGLREDVALSCYEDTLRVLDRERLAYYESAAVDSLVLGATGLDLDVTDFVGLVTGHAPGCGRFESVSVSLAGDGWEMSGRFDGADFRAESRGGRMKKASWPALFNGRADDRILVTYKWDRSPEGGIFLEELVIFLEERRWRVKMRAD